MTGPARRQVLTGTTAAVVGVPLLAACGEDDGGDQAVDPAESTPNAASGEALGDAADVPVGGCAVFADAKVVVTQPQEGTYKAFSAVCTHQQCLVTSSSEGHIPCTCHGSQFGLTDGAVLEGPATSPLAAVEITVTDGTITMA